MDLTWKSAKSSAQSLRENHIRNHDKMVLTSIRKEGFTIEKRANPSGHLSIPARRSPIPSSVVIGAVKVIAYYTVQGAIEIYVQNLARHASPYSVRHAPGGIIDGIVPGGVGRQDVYNNPSNFFPGDVLEISAVPK